MLKFDRNASGPRGSLARPGTRLADIGSVILVCGPATTDESLERLRTISVDWEDAIAAWRQGCAPYCIFVARLDAASPDGSFARPTLFCTHDRALLEQGLWAAVGDGSSQPFVLDSLESTMDAFVATLKRAWLHAPGHA